MNYESVKTIESPESNTGKFREWITSRNLTQKQVAELLGMSESSLNKKLNGKANFTEKDLGKLYRLLGNRDFERCFFNNIERR